MLTYQDVAKILKENPNCFIYYYDNGTCTIYESGEKYKQLVNMDYEDPNCDNFGKSITLLDVADSDDPNGYAPTIVRALASLLNIGVDST